MEIYLSNFISTFTRFAYYNLDDHSNKVRDIMTISPSKFLLGKVQYENTKEYFKLFPESPLGPFFFGDRMEYGGSIYYLDFSLEDDEVYPVDKGSYETGS